VLHRQFAGYELLGKLASGGMAEIYLARRSGGLRFEKLVAIKRLLPILAVQPEYVAMFGDEARILASLSHANIAHCLDFDCVQGIHYLALEYVHGESLAALIARCHEHEAQLPAPAVAYVGGALARALHHAHEARDPAGHPLGVLHRDVSPHNVLIGYDGQIKLIDFGVAQATGRDCRTGPGTLKGKFCYMAPEQFGDGPIDRRADLFALGVCLWEMAAGRRLFAAESDAGTMRQILDGGAPVLRDVAPVPAELSALVMSLLAIDPGGRPFSALEVARRLDEIALRLPRFDEAALAVLMQQRFAAERARKEEMVKVALAPTVEDFLFAERFDLAKAWDTLDSQIPVTVAGKKNSKSKVKRGHVPALAHSRRRTRAVYAAVALAVLVVCALLAAPALRQAVHALTTSP
jgi:eukaryotic-like serine/threonine-protein kinase